ncbi:MAG: hypothetical protein IJQ56_09225, partial [Synergistaceae bacterium]|nr:hypothetical protein [Synergistaceae bacterium]
MEIKKLHLIYFSPSGSTEKIIKFMAECLKDKSLPIETHNLLTSESRSKKYKFGADDLVIMGSMT